MQAPVVSRDDYAAGKALETIMTVADVEDDL